LRCHNDPASQAPSEAPSQASARQGSTEAREVRKHILPSDPPASQSLSAALKDAQIRLVVTLRRRIMPWRCWTSEDRLAYQIRRRESAIWSRNPLVSERRPTSATASSSSKPREILQNAFNRALNPETLFIYKLYQSPTANRKWESRRQDNPNTFQHNPAQSSHPKICQTQSRHQLEGHSH